jgi:hypothetical protein
VRVKKEIVAAVVAEASTKMGDPNYSAVLVGGFVEQQRAATQYITAAQRELGGAEAVVNCIFHAALIGLCYQRAGNRSVRALAFRDLDHVAGEDVGERLGASQLGIHEYIDSNVLAPEMRRLLYLLALAMDS